MLWMFEKNPCSSVVWEEERLTETVHKIYTSKEYLYYEVKFRERGAAQSFKKKLKGRITPAVMIFIVVV